MQKGSKFLKNSVIQMGPFVKVQIHVDSCSQSTTPPPRVNQCIRQMKLQYFTNQMKTYHASLTDIFLMCYIELKKKNLERPTQPFR